MQPTQLLHGDDPRCKEALGLLAGTIDMHVHSAPDVVPRRLSDCDAVLAAHDAGMHAVVLKNHASDTSGRAALLASMMGEPVLVYGGVVLNRPVGGINPYAVEVALRLGGKVVWMPTLDATHVPVLDEDGTWLSPVHEVLALIREAGAVLATGHLAPPVAVRLCQLARRMRINVVFTHPEWPGTRLPLEGQRALAAEGVVLERTAVSTYQSGGSIDLHYIAHEITELGAENSILSSDLGQPENPIPTVGLGCFALDLLRAGVSSSDLDVMTRQNPASLLGLA